MKTPPHGMIVVTKEQFFKALEADKRDIMPSTADPYATRWETTYRQLWGWDSTGWKSTHDTEQIWAIFPEALKTI